MPSCCDAFISVNINAYAIEQNIQLSKLHLSDNGEQYGDSSYMVKEFNMYEELEEIVKLASQPIPERPDGIVCVVKYSSARKPDCRKTEGEYERLARKNSDTVFLRSYAEYENAQILFGQAQVTSLPTIDVFYAGHRVGRMEGHDYSQIEELIKQYGFVNSKLDLFSEEAELKRKMKWGDGTAKYNAANTPRTTARFVPGYDWDKSKGFFDDIGDKMADDFENTYGNWIPTPVEDEK